MSSYCETTFDINCKNVAKNTGVFLTGTLKNVQELTNCSAGFSRWEDHFLSCQRQSASCWNGKVKLLWADLSDLSPVPSSRAKCLLFSCLMLLYLLVLASPQPLPQCIARYSLFFSWPVSTCWLFITSCNWERLLLLDAFSLVKIFFNSQNYKLFFK